MASIVVFIFPVVSQPSAAATLSTLLQLELELYINSYSQQFAVDASSGPWTIRLKLYHFLCRTGRHHQLFVIIIIAVIIASPAAPQLHQTVTFHYFMHNFFHYGASYAKCDINLQKCKHGADECRYYWSDC